MGQGSRRARRAFALLAVAAAVAVPAAFAGDAEYLGTSAAPSAATELVAATPNAYFVELAGSKATFGKQARAVGLKYTERFSYDRLFNGLSVSIAAGDRPKLAGIGSVKAIYPVYTAELAPTSTPDLATAVSQTGADLANAAGYTGEGVKVAIMDTGVDYDHPDLGGCFGAACRVTAGYDFVGDDFDANPANPTYNPVTTPDDDPDDCNGHGTHVAGIVGASPASASGVKGVAPDVTFGAYRVFGCNGSTTADIMLAAMEAALADGMHVLNMSIGSAFMTWPQYPTAAGADALVDAGMVVVASIGNSGVDGQYSAGAPGVGNDVIGVASFDNSHVSSLTFDAPGRAGIAYLPITSTDDPPTSGTTPEVVWVGQGCNADPYVGNPAGKVALIVRGACTFAEKYNKAVANGAVDVIIHNNLPGLFAGGGIVGQPGISAVGISLDDGMYLRSLASPYSVTWTSNRVNAVNPTGGLLSSFSSYGMNAELTLKPDIGGPGGLIRSTYPLEKGAYAIISGTSMSSPHVAGAAALLREARPTLAASEFRAILQNSSDPKLWSAAPQFGLLDYAMRQGAGMVDIDDAIASTSTITPGKLSFGEGAGGTGTLTIANGSASAQTFTLSHVGTITASGTATPATPTAAATNPPFSWQVWGPGQTATFSSPTVTVPAGGTASVDVSIAAAGLPQRSQYGGYVVLTRGDGKVFRVPYAGLFGDYQSIQHLRFALIGRIVGGAIQPMTAATSTFTLVGSDVPFVMPNLGHQARRLEIQVVDAATGAPMHPVFSNIAEEDYLSRNATANTVFTFAFDGTRMHDNGGGTPDHRKLVPDGQYKLVVKVLKALGDAANPDHWETWTSPAITIDRP